MGRVLMLGAAVVLAATVAGCGTQAPDLFALQRGGQVAGARLSLVVSDDGAVRCNGGRPRDMPSRLLLQARAYTREVAPDAKRGRRYPPRPGWVFRYAMRTQDGTVGWYDTSRPLPVRYLDVAYLVRQIAQQVCGLAR